MLKFRFFDEDFFLKSHGLPVGPLLFEDSVEFFEKGVSGEKIEVERSSEHMLFEFLYTEYHDFFEYREIHIVKHYDSANSIVFGHVYYVVADDLIIGTVEEIEAEEVDCIGGI